MTLAIRLISIQLQVYQGPERQCEASGLKPGYRYEARVRARNDEGHGAWSTPVSGDSLPGPPEAPRWIEATESQSGKMSVSWSESSDHGGAPLTGYKLQCCIDSGRWNETYAGVDKIFEMDAKGGGATHRFRVQAVNAEGASAYSPVGIASSAISIPGDPTGLIPVSQTGTTLKVKWGKAESGGSVILSWMVRVIKEGSIITEAILPAANMSYKASKLEVAQSYHIEVAAVNIVGQGTWSSPLVLSTTSEAPPSPKPLVKPVLKSTGDGSDEEDSPKLTQRAKKAKKARDLAFKVKEKEETEAAEKERKRLKYEASWRYQVSKVVEYCNKNPMVPASVFVAFLVLIMMFVGIDEEGPSGPSF